MNSLEVTLSGIVFLLIILTLCMVAYLQISSRNWSEISRSILDLFDADNPEKTTTFHNPNVVMDSTNCNLVEYKGFRSRIYFNAKNRVLFGKIEGTNVVFEGDSAENIEQGFREAVEDYLDIGGIEADG